jgi:PAS domain S-box-containing protein
MARPYTVLVVDDDDGARLLMQAALRKAGYVIRQAHGGEDALRQFRAAPCDMVMLDVEMPDLDGHQVCAILRAEAGPLLPIVMVTGMDDVASVEAAYEHGATDFIAKPVNWSMIGHRVRYLFRGTQALVDLGAEQARLSAVLNAIPDILFELDLNGCYHDYRAPRLAGVDIQPQALLGKTIHELLPAKAALICEEAMQLALQHGATSGQQFELPLPGGPRWFELSVSRKEVPVGEMARFIVLSRDITERKEAEHRIARLAYFDSLTGLPNRQSFLDRVDREVRRAAPQQRRLAVLFMDLDGFKTINDTLGHDSGDMVLQWTAQRLRDSLRPSDLLSRSAVPVEHAAANGSWASGPHEDEYGPVNEEHGLARLGGDEFTALILNIERPEDAIVVAERICLLMRQPFVLGGREVVVTASVGIALYPEDGQDGASLLKHADTAMYHAKSLGRDKAQIYNAALTLQIMQRLELETSLRAALEREEFHLVYQPQVDIASGRIHSVEALIRWAHPQRGLVSPLEFIALAEENGLIERIGLWVLRTACAQGAAWNAQGLQVRMAVNLSPLQFADSALPQKVMQTLAQTGLAPALLELEVTEGALMSNSAATRAALQTLRDHGVHIALDDFGTGFSSLSYLTRMPIGNIKVDKCFVSDMLHGGESTAIISAVLAMAHSLGMRVTAEGVETAEQALALQAMGCDSLQGFYFSRPVLAQNMPALLARRWYLGRAQGPYLAGRSG